MIRGAESPPLSHPLEAPGAEQPEQGTRELGE